MLLGSNLVGLMTDLHAVRWINSNCFGNPFGVDRVSEILAVLPQPKLAPGLHFQVDAERVGQGRERWSTGPAVAPMVVVDESQRLPEWVKLPDRRAPCR